MVLNVCVPPLEDQERQSRLDQVLSCGLACREVRVVRRAEELAVAMECRCYHGGEGRTRLKQLHMHRSDILIAVVAVLVFVAIGMSNLFFARIG